VHDSCTAAGTENHPPRYGATRDGNRKALPAEHLPKGYEPPRFRVQMEESQTEDVA
jgi:hypothetical protein